MKWVDEQDRILLSFARGEEVCGQLTRFCVERDLGHATVEGIGALEGITIGAYDLKRSRYIRHELQGGWEVLSFSGNFGWVGDEGMLHAHVTLADLDGHVRGGHLFAATVHVTLELVLRPGPTRLTRGMDEETGLNLWKLGEP